MIERQDDATREDKQSPNRRNLPINIRTGKLDVPKASSLSERRRSPQANDLSASLMGEGIRHFQLED